ncbi:MAG: hypothetical protein A2928_01695 [Candidatus Taylorbacteria bacterium RIFCSPLOWO2_01_FULL_45_15b]|uniref:Uncharacterized protein n=1 Tax=Candidatus Taylorbacteria bacterium RIFCSPLOWO2_01_FULL_45_15b TaxID=1802319 RepID=A0A1G2ND09_9BACT|nr:MAG: hypothetical protein A2928_01695 [Candidatus Taylorbacteria bacterium RIFCSPLOWO2_01_FULL_45_15b]
MSRKIKPKRIKKLVEFLSKSVSVFLFVIGANFSEARARRKEGIGGRNSAAPERSGQEFLIK